MRASSFAPIMWWLSPVCGALIRTKSARGRSADSLSGVCISSAWRCLLPLRRTPITCMSIPFAHFATAPPMWPTPTISSVLPPMLLLKHCRHRPLRWLVTISGTRLLSMRMAIDAYSVARRPWTPRLLVSTAPGGSQSSGMRWFTPAPCACIHFSRGARRARSWRGMSHANTTSAVFRRFSRMSPS